MRSSQRWLGMCAAVISAAGCGSHAATAGLRGEVTYEGHAVETGRIDFIPIDGTPGPSVGATVAGGRYAIPGEKGVLANGVYQVRITAAKKTVRTAPNRIMPGGPPLEIQENFIPAMYNDRSTLKVRVADLADEKKADFPLGRAPAPPR